MKSILFIILPIMIAAGCKNPNQTQSMPADETRDTLILTADEVLATPEVYADQQVVVTGMVSHVCKHGGQKLFLVSHATDKYLRINTSESIAEFPMDLEGSTIEVSGIVEEFEQEGTVEEGHESDTSAIEKSYHKDNFFVVVAESYVVKE